MTLVMNIGKSLREIAKRVNDETKEQLLAGPSLTDGERARIVKLGISKASQEAECGKYITRINLNDFERDEKKKRFGVPREEDAEVVKAFRNESIIAKFFIDEFRASDCRSCAMNYYVGQFDVSDTRCNCKNYGYDLDWSHVGETPKN